MELSGLVMDKWFYSVQLTTRLYSITSRTGFEEINTQSSWAVFLQLSVFEVLQRYLCLIWSRPQYLTLHLSAFDDLQRYFCLIWSRPQYLTLHLSVFDELQRYLCLIWSRPQYLYLIWNRSQCTKHTSLHTSRYLTTCRNIEHTTGMRWRSGLRTVIPPKVYPQYL